MDNDRMVVLFSGGLDSTVLLTQQARVYPTKAICFDYGSKHAGRERVAVAAICQRLSIDYVCIKLPFINELFKSDLLVSGGSIPDGHYEDEVMKRTIVPYRNTIMLAIAAGYAESVNAIDIVIGCHAGDAAIYPDCRVSYIIAFNRVLEEGSHQGIHLYAPYTSWSKAKIVLHGQFLGAPMELSWSCYKGGEKHCGKCGTCVERIEAFKLANVEDPTEYE